MNILLVNGPNLNLLGTREPDKYGSETLEEIEKHLQAEAHKHDIQLDCCQSNIEGEIVDFIQKANGIYDGIILNAGGYTHTSVAIRDAISAVNLPTIEVHISNIHRREEFRKQNMIAPVCTSSIVGFGPFGYHLAMVGMVQIMNEIRAVQEMQKQSQAAQAN